MPERRFEHIKPAESVIQKNRKNQIGGNYYRFPSDLGAHSVILNFKQYQYGGSELKNSVETSSIVLPLPQNLQDSFRVNVGANQLGISGALAAELGAGSNRALEFSENILSTLYDSIKSIGKSTASGLSDLSKKSFKDMLSTMRNALNSGLSGTGDITQFIVKSGLASIFPGLMDAFGAGKGTMINPYAALTFSGVDMKQHNFNWTFAPKSSRESDVLKDISLEIKRNILPETKSVGGDFTRGIPILNRGILRYPNMVDIFFLGLDQPYFYFFKTCMVNGFDVSYTPQGPAFLKGGKPAIVTMNMNLVEADIHTREDYEMEEWEG
jgi:hypothetical protein